MGLCYLCDMNADFICSECGTSVCRKDLVIKGDTIICYVCFSKK